MLKCEYPEGCRLDLWAKVIKAKYIEKGAKVLEITQCIPCASVGGYVSVVDDFKIKVNSATEILNFNKVKITINFDLILVLIVGTAPDTDYQVYTLPNNIYEETIDLCEFDPPLTSEEFRSEIDSSEVVLCNWDFDYDIKGNCEDYHSPCRHRYDEEDGRCPIEPGTCMELLVYVDIIDKLGKWHDVIVYGELDPEVDC
ncbi:MAG: hypothetical protein PHZ03_06820 [Syntrophomonas sp.]|nr:hypothetical protein [Syntrophomonas sp.]